MEKVVGIGGIFFKADDAETLRNWYQQHLGIEVDPSYGGRCSTSQRGRS